MIQRFRPGTLRRPLGFIGRATLMPGIAALSQAAVHAPEHQSATPDFAYNAAIPPPYPADALKNHDQGTVVLSVTVGKAGKAGKIVSEPSSQACPN